MSTFFKKNWQALVTVVLIVLFSGYFHAKNMFYFPFFENDEGTYMAQAWSLISEQKLAPYTYWYDHAPFGWIFTSIWILLTGGLFTFGFSLNSARVFMLVIHAINAVLLYILAEKTTKSKMVGVIALLFFSISPLAVYFQRRLLLDNLMVFWILIGLVLLFWKERLSIKIASAVTFALAVLTKENAVFFMPVFVYFAWKQSDHYQRVAVVVTWLFVAGSIISLYPLYALLKGELFPYGSLFSPDHPHVSLLGTLAMHAQRGSGLPFWESGSDFYTNMEYWLSKDWLFIVLGYWSFFYHGVRGFWARYNWRVFILTLPMVVFLASGRLVINFYIIPLIPFFSLGIGLFFKDVCSAFLAGGRYISARQSSYRKKAQPSDLKPEVTHKKTKKKLMSKKMVALLEQRSEVFSRNKAKVTSLQADFLKQCAQKQQHHSKRDYQSLYTYLDTLSMYLNTSWSTGNVGRFVCTAAICTMFILHYADPMKEYLHKDEVTSQHQAITWIREHVDPEDAISIDFYSYLDLQKAGSLGHPVFTGADWFWKVELDPDIREKKLHNNPENVKYVMVTAEVQRQVHTFGPDSLLKQVWDASHVVAQFESEDDFEFDFNQTSDTQSFPNGDWVVLLKQNDRELERIWQIYRDAHVHRDGYVIMPGDEDSVITEAQAYALLRAVWMDDKETFDTVYQWTVDKMKLEDTYLFGWHWSHSNQSLLDGGNATDADQDIALALLFAERKWGDYSYAQESQKILDAIWQHTVYESENYAIITAGNWGDSGEYVTINPSYFAPYMYRIFATADPDHDWMKVVDSSYDLLDQCSRKLFGSSQRVYLPPEWCRFYKHSESVAESLSPQPESTEYGFNAFRVPWRVYLDYQWYGEERALEYLNNLSFFVEQYQSTGKIADVYTSEGEPLTDSSKYGMVMSLPVFMASNSQYAKEMSDTVLKKELDLESAHWYDGQEYYLQNWYWFMLGMYQGELDNLFIEN